LFFLLRLQHLPCLVPARPRRPTRRQFDSSSRGYSEQQIENNRFRVQFAGNSLTDRKTVETYLLYRAAELTKAERV
jgi:hypothetical protein